MDEEKLIKKGYKFLLEKEKSELKELNQKKYSFVKFYNKLNKEQEKINSERELEDLENLIDNI